MKEGNIYALERRLSDRPLDRDLIQELSLECGRGYRDITLTKESEKEIVRMLKENPTDIGLSDLLLASKGLVKGRQPLPTHWTNVRRIDGIPYDPKSGMPILAEGVCKLKWVPLGRVYPGHANELTLDHGYYLSQPITKTEFTSHPTGAVMYRKHHEIPFVGDDLALMDRWSAYTFTKIHKGRLPDKAELNKVFYNENPFRITTKYGFFIPGENIWREYIKGDEKADVRVMTLMEEMSIPLPHIMTLHRDSDNSDRLPFRLCIPVGEE